MILLISQNCAFLWLYRHFFRLQRIFKKLFIDTKNVICPMPSAPQVFPISIRTVWALTRPFLLRLICSCFPLTGKILSAIHSPRPNKLKFPNKNSSGTGRTSGSMIGKYSFIVIGCVQAAIEKRKCEQLLSNSVWTHP